MNGIAVGDTVLVDGVWQGVVTGLEAGAGQQLQVEFPDVRQDNELRFCRPDQVERLAVPRIEIGPRLRARVGDDVWYVHPAAFGLPDEADPLPGSTLRIPIKFEGKEGFLEATVLGEAPSITTGPDAPPALPRWLTREDLRRVEILRRCSPLRRQQLLDRALRYRDQAIMNQERRHPRQEGEFFELLTSGEAAFLAAWWAMGVHRNMRIAERLVSYAAENTPSGQSSH